MRRIPDDADAFSIEQMHTRRRNAAATYSFGTLLREAVAAGLETPAGILGRATPTERFRVRVRAPSSPPIAADWSEPPPRANSPWRAGR
jgi:hypothetical protein